jgi:Protein of unknown function (DUF3006)
MTEKTREQAKKMTTLFIDEIEDDSARLLFDQRSFTIPRALLPEDSREGEWLILSVARTSPPPSDTAARRERMGADDPGGTIKL